MILNETSVSLTSLDVAFFIATLAISVLIGVYFTFKNTTLNDYMLGGRDQKLLPVSLSMMTSFISGLTLVGNPAEFYYHGVGFTLIITAMLLSVPFSSFILLPVFHRIGSLSIYNYLELRFNKTIKRFVSLSLMIQMILYNAVVLYVPSLSLKSVLGISESISILAVGCSCLIYSTLGGIKAVIWTDFFQAGLMYLSLLSIFVAGTYEAGGVKQLIDSSFQSDRLNFKEFFQFSNDLTTRHTIFTLVTGAVIINVFMNGANQIQVQRSLSLPTLRQAQLSQLIASLFTILISFMASYIGMILYFNYKNCDPFENKEIDKRDSLLIYYISKNLDYLPGFRGVFVAGIFAATLSTLSSFQNSMSALLLEDFIKPSLNTQLSDKKATYISKILSLLFGLACIGLTFVVGRISGLLQVVYTLFGALGAPFLSAFLLGMLTRFINSTGMLIGMIIGFLFGLYVQIYQTFYLPPLLPSKTLSIDGCHQGNSSSTFNLNVSIQPLATTSMAFSDFAKMSYLWLPAFAMLITCSSACLVSLLTGGWSQKVDDRFLVSWLHCNANEDNDDNDDDEINYYEFSSNNNNNKKDIALSNNQRITYNKLLPTEV